SIGSGRVHLFRLHIQPSHVPASNQLPSTKLEERKHKAILHVQHFSAASKIDTFQQSKQRRTSNTNVHTSRKKLAAVCAWWDSSSVYTAKKKTSSLKPPSRCIEGSLC
ncbi:hypothetical protein VIGAN_10238200, partial [Vigna angularis var. angularis]